MQLKQQAALVHVDFDLIFCCTVIATGISEGFNAKALIEKLNAKTTHKMISNGVAFVFDFLVVEKRKKERDRTRFSLSLREGDRHEKEKNTKISNKTQLASIKYMTTIFV